MLALPPCKPLPSIPSVYVDDALYIRVVDKYNTKGGRDKRILLVRRCSFVLVDVKAPHAIKRQVKLPTITNVLTKGDALLFKIAKQHDLLLYFPNDSRNVDKFDIAKFVHILHMAAQALNHTINFQPSTSPLKSQANVAKPRSYVDPQLRIKTYFDARKTMPVHVCHKPDPEIARQIQKCGPIPGFSDVFARDASYIRIVSKVSSRGADQVRILMLRPRTMLLVDVAKGHQIKRCIELSTISKIVTFEEEMILFCCPQSHDLLIRFEPPDPRNIEPFSMGKLLHILRLSTLACGFSIQSVTANTAEHLREQANLIKEKDHVSPTASIEKYMEDKRQQEILSCSAAAVKDIKKSDPPTAAAAASTAPPAAAVNEQPALDHLQPITDNQVTVQTPVQSPSPNRVSIASIASIADLDNSDNTLIVRKRKDQPLGICFAGDKDLTIAGLEPGSPAGNNLNQLVGSQLTHINKTKVETVSDVQHHSTAEVIILSLVKVVNIDAQSKLTVVQKDADVGLGIVFKPSTLEIAGFHQMSPLQQHQNLIGSTLTHVGSSPVRSQTDSQHAGIGAEVVTVQTTPPKNHLPETPKSTTTTTSSGSDVNNSKDYLIQSLMSENSNLRYLLAMAGPPVQKNVTHEICIQTDPEENKEQIQVNELQILVEHLSGEVDREKLKNRRTVACSDAATETDTEIIPILKQFCDEEEAMAVSAALSARGITSKSELNMDVLAPVTPPAAARKILRACQSPTDTSTHDKCNYRLHIAHEENKNLREAIGCLKQQIAVLQGRLGA
eukprot:TRINITY_DN16484_c0_g1_i1.p1 TRINITY_DN16484_c0_g1~~TRINITY_DN16484_c0_g1_i1.p1  ORF type:complete len:784 (+),score=149.92 TRINITY_DN16484_c0_g1_i1:52-2403(+)